MNEALDEFMIDKRQPYRFSFLAAGLWLLFLVVGILFRILHWPGADVIILLASSGLSAYAFASLIARKGKNIFALALSLSGIAWSIFIVHGALANNGHPFNEDGVIVYVISVLLVYIYYSWAIRKKYSI